jgi:hypothetical protein
VVPQDFPLELLGERGHWGYRMVVVMVGGLNVDSICGQFGTPVEMPGTHLGMRCDCGGEWRGTGH